MKDRDIVDVAITVFIAVTVVPIVLGGVVALTELGMAGVSHIIGSIKYNNKIKKGLKDGTIVKFDGQYYDAVVTNVEET